MRYRVVTYDDNGQEKIKKSTKGGKALYLLSDETGATHLADRAWMKAHQNQISNIGISGRQVYLVTDRFNKATETILNTWRQELLKGRSILTSDELDIARAQYSGHNKKLLAWAELKNYGDLNTIYSRLLDKLIASNHNIKCTRQNINGRVQMEIKL